MFSMWLYLALEGITDSYIRSDEKSSPSDDTCDLEEATIALACANDDATLAVQAKREIGKLWEDKCRDNKQVIVEPAPNISTNIS
jgi:hypothetical protein